jgi:hypothetical protein
LKKSKNQLTKIDREDLNTTSSPATEPVSSDWTSLTVDEAPPAGLAVPAGRPLPCR